jgi:acyl-CoA reductase-like NAD-dependent aldehyde dehydrogenase
MSYEATANRTSRSSASRASSGSIVVGEGFRDRTEGKEGPNDPKDERKRTEFVSLLEADPNKERRDTDEAEEHPDGEPLHQRELSDVDVGWILPRERGLATGRRLHATMVSMSTRTIDTPRWPTGLFLGGTWTHPNTKLTVSNPFTGKILAKVAAAGVDHVETAVGTARDALERPPTLAERARVLDRAALLLEERLEFFAETIALEAGKPIRQARGETARSVETIRFAAAHARQLGGEVIPMDAAVSGAGKLAIWVREPVGIVAAICPFNFPLNLVCHKVAPAIAAGCPVIVKPAEETPLSALSLAALFAEAGLAAGALQVLTGDGATIGGALVHHPDVALVSFTGSAAVGWQIRADAPRKDVALELGNSTPVIVAADADLDHAVRRLAATGYTHAGQSCISVQRVYVHRTRYEEFTSRFLELVDALVTGDPLDETVDVGPVINASARTRVLEWVAEAVAAGAECLVGGPTDGPLVAPIVLAGIDPSMRVSHDEVFGPVVGLASFGEIDEAIALANSTPYGLQAGIFTARVDHGLQWAKALRFAGVTINESPTFRADQMPYGGVGESGNTREGPAYAIERMSERKLVVIDIPR